MSIQRLIGAVFLAIGLANMVVAADSRPDVSQIINKTEASAVLGEPVKDPSPRSGDGTDGYYSKCNYYSVSRGKSLIIRLQLPGPNAIGPQQELRLLAAANGAMEKVSGLGDVAQMSTSGGDSGFASRVLMLYVAKGNAFLTIGLGGFVDDAIALEKAKTVAQKLLEQL
ncbi:MAG TPA: hypothetical protein VGZ31_09320 [Chthoniobacterales bacterium]|jgi:hypothetical protein|nr:hypothetical protein [Chthoniobacterales bacterium]